MTRRTLPWLVGIGLVALTALVAGLAMAWLAASLEVEVTSFWSTNTGEIDEAEYRRFDELSQRSYLLQSLARPALMGAVAGALALLAALALQWDRARDRA